MLAIVIAATTTGAGLLKALYKICVPVLSRRQTIAVIYLAKG
jgi:hypothetical protein